MFSQNHIRYVIHRSILLSAFITSFALAKPIQFDVGDGQTNFPIASAEYKLIAGPMAFEGERHFKRDRLLFNVDPDTHFSLFRHDFKLFELNSIMFARNPETGSSEPMNIMLEARQRVWSDFFDGYEFQSQYFQIDNVNALNNYVFGAGVKNVYQVDFFGNLNKTGITFGNIDVTSISPVPEPATYVMMFAGLGLFYFTRKKKYSPFSREESLSPA